MDYISHCKCSQCGFDFEFSLSDIVDFNGNRVGTQRVLCMECGLIGSEWREEGRWVVFWYVPESYDMRHEEDEMGKTVLEDGQSIEDLVCPRCLKREVQSGLTGKIEKCPLCKDDTFVQDY